MNIDKNKDIESERKELLDRMEEFLSPELKKLIEISYRLSKKEPENFEVITSNFTSDLNRLNA